jgi:hypothetical protein
VKIYTFKYLKLKIDFQTYLFLLTLDKSDHQTNCNSYKSHMSRHAIDLPPSPIMIITAFPYYNKTDGHHLPYILFLEDEERTKDRKLHNSKRKMELCLGLWARIRRKVWETPMYSEIEIAKDVEEVREKVNSMFF